MQCTVVAGHFLVQDTEHPVGGSALAQRRLLFCVRWAGPAGTTAVGGSNAIPRHLLTCDCCVVPAHPLPQLPGWGVEGGEWAEIDRLNEEELAAAGGHNTCSPSY